MTTETFVPLAQDTRPAPTTQYEHAFHAFLDEYFAAYPVRASFSGFHLLDHLWGDFTEDGRRARLRMLGRQRAALEQLDDGRLSPSERIDRGVLLEAIEQTVFDEDVLREPAWDPLSYVYVLGSGFFALLAREYAPWAHRGGAFLERMRGLPEVFEAAAVNLVGTDGRPVSLLHTETALNQLSGVTDLIDEAIAEAGRRAEAGEGQELRDALEAEAPRARAAVDRFREALETEIRDRASGDGRLGSELFQQKLRHTLSSDLPFEALHERAKRDFTVVRSEMVRLAREAWPTWVRGEPLPESSPDPAEDLDGTIVRRVLDAIAHEHRRPDELLEWCQAEIGRIEAFCRERAVIGLPDEPLRITWTPAFMRAYGRAFLDWPGPLDRGQSSYFWITPPDESAGDEAVESYLREDNDRMLKLLCIHEGVPGHYLQLAWSNRLGSLTRSIFANGMFAEGWAVYVTQVMMDLGYGGHEAALLLNHWKFYLRAITNAIMDVEIHTAGMTEEQAMDLMVRGGFQEEDEARAKWLRARLTSTQLSTYYLGSLEMWDMEVEARTRAARAAGVGDGAVPEQRIVGGLGETPGFDYRRHLESVISFGSPPVKWVRRILSDPSAVPEPTDSRPTVAPEPTDPQPA